ncbi:hypothetical protein [Dyella sp.]|jgi:hypothetical protein|uniref:hypothetical protein n=1 Tax=Dyella sp. TaxID=1869338 RepID=UPI002D784154|nr:hypothetical protein [Dyella sp.]HET6433692.1 hypothetical protein [Dyella sp.]
MSSIAAGIPIEMAIGMGSGIAIGVASGTQAGRRKAAEQVAAWLQEHGVQLVGAEGAPLAPETLLAVVAGKSR